MANAINAITVDLIKRMAPGRKVEFYQSDSPWPYDCMIRIDSVEHRFDRRELMMPIGEFKTRIVDPIVSSIERQREYAAWDDIASRMAICV
jgi:hypothetical protein